MAEELHVKKREGRGTRFSRRLRARGETPSVLYGHGKENIALAVPTEEIEAAIRHGSHLVDLRGDVTDTALIREIQWDTFGHDVLHVDFTRVERGEKAELALTIELRGDAPGTKEGGILEQNLHQLEIECPVSAIPEKIVVRVNDLHVGVSVLAKDVELPEGARLLGDPDETVVQCVEAAPLPEVEEAVPGEAAEPEVIGQKKEEETED